MESKPIIQLELAEALTSYRAAYTLFAQFLGIILVSNVSIIGFAFNNKNDVLFLLGAICPLIILIIRVKLRQRMLPLIYTSFHLETKLNNDNIDLLIKTHLEISLTSTANKLYQINRLETQEERMKALKKACSSLRYNLFGRSFLFGTLLYLFLSIFQIVLYFIS